MLKLRSLFLSILLFSSISITGCQFIEESIEFEIKMPDFTFLEDLKGEIANTANDLMQIAEQLPHQDWFEDLRVEGKELNLQYYEDAKNVGNGIFTGNIDAIRMEAITAAALYFSLSPDLEQITLETGEVTPITIAKASFYSWLRSEGINPEQPVQDLYEQLIRNNLYQSFYQEKRLEMDAFFIV